MFPCGDNALGYYEDRSHDCIELGIADEQHEVRKVPLFLSSVCISHVCCHNYINHRVNRRILSQYHNRQ